MQRNVLVMVSSLVAPRLAGVARCARERGWFLMVYDRMSADAYDWMGDGVVATIRRDARSFAFLRHLMRRGVPVVDLTCDRPALRVPRVMSDHLAIGRLAAEHFAERNFRRRVFFSVEWGHVHALRRDGLASLGPVETWVFQRDRPHARWNDWDAVSRWIEGRLASATTPLAALAYSQGDAVRLLSAAMRLGIAVPEQLVIVSSDNDPVMLENQPVPVSAVESRWEESAYLGASLLGRLMDGEAPPREPLLVPPAGIVQRRSSDSTAAADPLVGRALRLVGERIARPFGAQQLAAELGVGRGTLDRHFLAELGRTASDEIRRRRLALAKGLLRETGATAAAVAAAAGYSSPSHLDSAFREAVGLTPRAWRRSGGARG